LRRIDQRGVSDDGETLRAVFVARTLVSFTGRILIQTHSCLYSINGNYSVAVSTFRAYLGSHYLIRSSRKRTVMANRAVVAICLHLSVSS